MQDDSFNIASDSNETDEEKIRDFVEDAIYQNMKQGKIEKKEEPLSPQFYKIAVDCINTHNIVLLTHRYCQTLGGIFSDSQTLNTLQDCIEFTELMDNLILRHSSLVKNCAPLCVLTCERCLDIARLLPEDQQMKTLIEFCKIAIVSLKQIT